MIKKDTKVGMKGTSVRTFQLGVVSHTFLPQEYKLMAIGSWIEETWVP